jgi:Notch-like protein
MTVYFYEDAACSYETGQPMLFNTSTCTDVSGNGHQMSYWTSCSVISDDCDSNPCQNGGSCYPSGGQDGYTCQCPYGYAGVNCEEVTQQSAITLIYYNTTGDCYATPSDRYQGSTGDCFENPYGEWLQVACDNDGDFLLYTYGDDECSQLSRMQTFTSGMCYDFGWSGLSSIKYICGDDLDDCASDPCQNGGTCIDQADWFECDCPVGYYGTECEVLAPAQNITIMVFNDTDTCDGQHPTYSYKGLTGQCVTDELDEYGVIYICYGAGVDAFLFESPDCTGQSYQITFEANICYDYGVNWGNQEYFYSQILQCGEPSNPNCPDEPCQNGGTCVDYFGTWQCLCPGTWTGAYCNFPAAQVTFEQYENSATCGGSPTTYSVPSGVCSKDPQSGSLWAKCQGAALETVDVHYFSDDNCVYSTGVQQTIHTGDCTSTGSPSAPTSTIIECLYYHSLCDSSPCQNGGSCMDSTTFFICACPMGFSGDFCEVSSPPLVIVSQQWVTPDCSGATPPITKQLTSGQCVSNPAAGESGMAICKGDQISLYRFSDDTCGTIDGDVSVFRNGQCENFGEYGLRYICQNPCGSFPCMNGGTCDVAGVGAGFTCICPLGFIGTICQNPDTRETAVMSVYNTTDKCEGIMDLTYSGASGECLLSNDMKSSARIVCGDQANSAVLYSDPTCTKVKIPTFTFDDSSCQDFSDAPFSFLSLEIICDNNACLPNPCMYGGTCVDGVGVNIFTCQCPAGYSGEVCEGFACASSPCQNGGQCSMNAGGYSCFCSNGFSGTTCGDAVLSSTDSNNRAIIGGIVGAVSALALGGLAFYFYNKRQPVLDGDGILQREPLATSQPKVASYRVLNDSNNRV